MATEWLAIHELEEKVEALERELRETKSALGETTRELADVRFELEWERLMASNEAAAEAYDTVQPYGEEAVRSFAHAYRLTRDARGLPRLAQHIVRDIEKKRFRPFDPLSVRKELEATTARPKHKGVVNNVDLGWDWNGKHFWTEREAQKARQARIDETVAARSAKAPY